MDKRAEFERDLEGVEASTSQAAIQKILASLYYPFSPPHPSPPPTPPPLPSSPPPTPPPLPSSPPPTLPPLPSSPPPPSPPSTLPPLPSPPPTPSPPSTPPPPPSPFLPLSLSPPSSPSPPLRSPSPPPPVVPAEREFNTYPQPVGSQRGGYDGFIPVGAAPQMQLQMPMVAAPTMQYGPGLHSFRHPGQLCGQAGAYSQGQHHPYQRPAYGFPTAAAAGHPAAPLLQNGNPLMLRQANGLDLHLQPVGTLNGEILYAIKEGYYLPPVPAAPPAPKPSNPRKRRRDNQQDDSAPYVKKPPNAFMLFMKEHRPSVDAGIKTKGNAAVNTFLGQKWKSLTEEEQASYYEQANQEKRLHEQQHPDWSCRENYGKKRKRVRRRANANTEASAPTHEEEPQQAKRLCVAPAQTAVVEPSSSEASAREALHMQSLVTESSLEAQVLDLDTWPELSDCLFEFPDVDDFSFSSWLDDNL